MAIGSRSMRTVVVALVCVPVLASCGRGSESEPTRLPLGHRFSTELEGNPIVVRVAIREEEQQDGLMRVASLPENEGMLFVFDEPRRMSFWMRNTRIPLDIGYFDSDGVLREIYAMYPGVEDPVESRSLKIRYALEMNQGWYRTNGVKPGARLDLEELRRMIRARGFESRYFVDR